MNNAETANRIRAVCKLKGLAVGKALEGSVGRKGLIYDLEKRDWTPSAEVLEKLADYYGCSVDYLLGRTEVPEVNRKRVEGPGSD